MLALPMGSLTDSRRGAAAGGAAGALGAAALLAAAAELGGVDAGSGARAAGGELPVQAVNSSTRATSELDEKKRTSILFSTGIPKDPSTHAHRGQLSPSTSSIRHCASCVLPHSVTQGFTRPIRLTAYSA